MTDIYNNWPSPAKLNLFLHITGRRSNGYHDLQTLFQILDKGDSLDFEVNNNGEISLSHSIDGVPDAENLVYKAAKLLQTSTGTQSGCQITLHKTLPMGGGIGGGSSNAATTLVALNLLWNLNLTTQALMELGVQLGADIPVFINGQTAFAEGVGEKLFSTRLEPKYYLVVNPGVHVSTAEVFTDPALPRNTSLIRWQDYEFAQTHNDCQQLVCEKYPVIAKTLQWLLQYAPSRMTGTGASLFAVFDTFAEAQKCLTEVPDYCQAFIAKGCHTSPLFDKLNIARRGLCS